MMSIDFKGVFIFYGKKIGRNLKRFLKNYFTIDYEIMRYQPPQKTIYNYLSKRKKRKIIVFKKGVKDEREANTQ